MYIPSERVHEEMNSEAASIWFVPTLGTDNFAVLIKVPSNSLKAIIAGCNITFVIGKNKIEDNNYLCTGVKIYDTCEAEMLFYGIQRHAEEHQALWEILSCGSAPVFLFNEMDICIAWANVSIKKDESQAAISFIGNLNELYVGEFNSQADHCLDCFGYTLDEKQKVDGAYKIDNFFITPSFQKWTINNIHFLGYLESNKFRIDDKDEGPSFERIIWSSLESVFPLTLHKKPQVTIGNNNRELIDILSFYSLGTFLIEAKALSVLEAGCNRSLERKVKGIQKQIKKAIGQLIGATKAIKRNDIVCDNSGKELKFDRNIIPHCIVLISELYHFGEWKEIENLLIEAVKKTGAFFHVLDLRDFLHLLKACSGKPELMDYNLMQRFELFGKTGSIHIRGRVAPKSVSNNLDSVKS